MKQSELLLSYSRPYRASHWCHASHMIGVYIQFVFRRDVSLCSNESKYFSEHVRRSQPQSLDSPDTNLHIISIVNCDRQ